MSPGEIKRREVELGFRSWMDCFAVKVFLNSCYSDTIFVTVPRERAHTRARAPTHARAQPHTHTHTLSHSHTLAHTHTRSHPHTHTHNYVTTMSL